MAHRITDLPERVSQKIMAAPDGCWLWTGAASTNQDGKTFYGRLTREGQTLYAHRYVYELLVGPIQADTLDHLCRQTLCVNPHHLDPVSQRVNILRGNSPSARRARQTHCKRGHVLRGDNVMRYGTSRKCRTCNRESSAAWQRRNRSRA